MENEKTDLGTVPETDEHQDEDLGSNLSRALGLGTSADKYRDDEMQRPPEDRSPLT